MFYKDRTEERNKGIKQCLKCKQTFPNTKVYFDKNKQTGDGLHYYCKACRNAVRKEWGRKNPEKILKYRTRRMASDEV